MCKECNRLLAQYRLATSVYKLVAHNIRGALGDDFNAVLIQVRAMHASCVTARELMDEHWNECHGGRDGTN